MRVKFFLFPAANILIALCLLIIFFIAGQNVIQTFPVANMAALNNLQPQPIDYLWELNINRAPLDKNKIRLYADYYEHLLQVFPSLWEAYGLLGYCYHYLNDDPKAIKFLKIAIQKDPDYFWNYYNLAVIDINESRYQAASSLLQKALNVPLVTSFQKMFSSRFVYAPLLGSGDKKVFIDTSRHLKETYQSSFIIVEILNQTQNNKEAQEMAQKLKPELYAF